MRLTIKLAKARLIPPAQGAVIITSVATAFKSAPLHGAAHTTTNPGLSAETNFPAKPVATLCILSYTQVISSPSGAINTVTPFPPVIVSLSAGRHENFKLVA